MNAHGEPTWGEFYAQIDQLGRQVTEAKLDLRVALMMLALAAGVLDFSKRDEKGNLLVPTVEELETIVRDMRVRLTVAEIERDSLRAAAAAPALAEDSDEDEPRDEEEV